MLCKLEYNYSISIDYYEPWFSVLNKLNLEHQTRIFKKKIYIKEHFKDVVHPVITFVC